MNRGNLFGILITVLVFAASVIAAEESATCRKCTMKLNEAGKKFAVIMPKIPGMESSSFDDIGCAIAWRNGECATRQSNFDSHALTHDYVTGEQIAMEKSFYAVGAGVKTPKGYDIAAFREKAAAEKLVAERGKGQVLKLFELVDLPLK